VIIFCALFVVIFLVGALYQQAGRRRDQQKFPAPGRLVEVDGNQFHLLEMGTAGPNVIFEAGIAASSVSWTLVQSRVAQFARTYSYDRAGLGWSGPVRTPRTLRQSIAELRALLKAGGVFGPYLLVGHSYGGLLMQAYAAAYPEEVSGLVLVDPVAVREWAQPSGDALRRLRRGVRLSRRGVWLTHIGVVRFALARLLSGNSSLPQRIAKMASGGGANVASRLVGEVGKLPRESWPVVQAHWCDPKCFVGMAAHLEQLPASAASLGGLGPIPDVPVCVVSSGTSTNSERAERAAVVSAVSFGEHIIAERSGHWIQLDEPELVADACRRMLFVAQRDQGIDLGSTAGRQIAGDHGNSDHDP
jgi:pimeloyl-ACP methyl ester carboxylesterase